MGRGGSNYVPCAVQGGREERTLLGIGKHQAAVLETNIEGRAAGEGDLSSSSAENLGKARRLTKKNPLDVRRGEGAARGGLSRQA